jgi:formylmethanofuran dehydrogenase subunit D
MLSPLTVIEAPKKPKRPVSQKVLANLAKGREKAREALNAKHEAIRKQKQEYIESLAVKKANNLIKKKLNLKKDFGLTDVNSEEEEEIIVPIQHKKAKKKQVVYLPQESDSEEEILFKKAPARKSKPKDVDQVIEVPQHRLVFY